MALFDAAVAKPDAFPAAVSAAFLAAIAVTDGPQIITFSLPDTDGVLGAVENVIWLPLML